jgi:hypothetical protein
MTTLRDALSSALEASEAGTLQSVEDTPIDSVESAPLEVSHETETPEAKAERVRDESGRFAAKPAEVAKPAEALQPRKPPSSWKKDYWEDFGKLDPKIQEYIDQREGEAAKGVSTYKQQVDQFAPIQQALQPYLPTLQQRGIAPDRFIQDLTYVDRVLSSGSMVEKTQLLHRMAAQNGIQLGQQAGQQGDPNLQYLLQTVNGLENRLQAFTASAAQQEQNALSGQIKQFGATHPHLEKVRMTMGRLLQSKFVDGDAFASPVEAMEAAYEKAIWMHDDIRQELVTQQATPAARQAEIARKKAAGSSPRSASPTGVATAGNGKKSLRDSLSENYDLSVGGRF